MAVELQALLVADEPETWEALGFAVAGGRAHVGGVDVELVGRGEGEGIVGWRLAGVATQSLDGLATNRDGPVAGCAHRHDAAPPDGAAHPNGAVAVDHVVALTGDFDGSAKALRRAGLDLRRIREVPDTELRQGFFLLGASILELGGPVEGYDAARFWGITFSVADLDAAAALLGDKLGAPRAAVQPGRRIATVRSTAGASVPLAFMTPREPSRPSS